MHSVSALHVTLRTSISMVYLLVDRNPVELSASRPVGFSKRTVLIARTGIDVTYSIPDPTPSLNDTRTNPGWKLPGAFRERMSTSAEFAKDQTKPPCIETRISGTTRVRTSLGILLKECTLTRCTLATLVCRISVTRESNGVNKGYMSGK